MILERRKNPGVRRFWILLGVWLVAALPWSGAEARMRLAVVDFQDNASGAGVRMGEPIRKAITDMLTTELFKTQLFTLVERTRIEAIAREHRLSAAGLVAPEQAVQLGRLLGAGAIITGAITQFALQEFATPGNSDRAGYVTLDVRVIDAESGEVLLVAQGQGKADKIKGADYFRDVTQGEQEGQGILGAATMDAVRRVVGQLVASPHLVEAFHLIDGGGPRVKIDAGSTRGGVKRGDLFVVYVEGEPVLGVDGSVLGVDRTMLGVLRVTAVQPRFSTAELVRGEASQLRRGDFVMRLEGAPEDVELGSR
ncbi:MAG TPA: CsgG/HfaB family protein [Synergistaceae bacterium]|nr:CsgG/HfaB family protein [Synergistaceae bacterium]HQH79404.1 CsgG/HfaB family protein [Synergistaceae bacterium]